jgi:negative regulator of sigma E activity
MTRHVSAETLARFRDGSLRRGQARRVRAHLDGCARCRDNSAALAQIPALLAGTVAPPIPAHLAARIETALATEAAHRAAGSPSVRSPRPARRGRAGQAGHAAPRRSRPRLPAPALRVLAAAAAVVIVGGGSYALVSGTSHSTGSGTASTSGHARSQAGESGGAARPGARAPAALGPAVRYQATGQSATIRPVRTATNYQPGQLSRQVSATLAQVAGARTMSPHISLPGADGRFGSGQLAQLSGCLSRVAGGQPLRLVDLAQFRGSPATIIVTAASGSRAGQIWVVGPACSRSASDVLARQQLPGG